MLWVDAIFQVIDQESVIERNHQATRIVVIVPIGSTQQSSSTVNHLILDYNHKAHAGRGAEPGSGSLDLRHSNYGTGILSYSEGNLAGLRELFV